MNALTQQDCERNVVSPPSTSFSKKVSWLFYAAGLFFFSAGVVYQLVWMRIFHLLYDAPYSGDLVASAAEIATAKDPIAMVMYAGTYLLWSLGGGALCIGFSGYIYCFVKRKRGGANLDAGSVRAGISIGKNERPNTMPGRINYRPFMCRTCLISLLLSIALFVSALLHQRLWDGVFDRFVGTAVKLPVELIMHGGTFLLLGLSVGALCVALVGVGCAPIFAPRYHRRGK